METDPKREVITQATRQVGEMQDSVAVNRKLVDRTRLLIDRLNQLLGRPRQENGERE